VVHHESSTKATGANSRTVLLTPILPFFWWVIVRPLSLSYLIYDQAGARTYARTHQAGLGDSRIGKDKYSCELSRTRLSKLKFRRQRESLIRRGGLGFCHERRCGRWSPTHKSHSSKPLRHQQLRMVVRFLTLPYLLLQRLRTSEGGLRGIPSERCYIVRSQAPAQLVGKGVV
jgi:hypothetical protein